jgi:hypothetical protein
MGFLLLGVDSLIACIAVATIVDKRIRIPFAICFGIGDGGGFLLGTALHWNMPGGVANVVETGVMLALGVYWIAVALVARKATGTKWVWVLPWVLSIDNITFGLIDHAWSHSVAVQAAEQAISSALLAGLGLAIGLAIPRMIPAVQRSRVATLGFAGGALIVAAGLELLVG